MKPMKHHIPFVLILTLLNSTNCHITTQKSNGTSISIQKIIQGRDTISGTPYYISCITTPGPNTSTTWINPKGQIIPHLNDRIRIETNVITNPSSSRKIQTTDLVFNPIHTNDTGNYTCLLKTDTQNKTAYHFLTVIPN